MGLTPIFGLVSGPDSHFTYSNFFGDGPNAKPTQNFQHCIGVTRWGTTQELVVRNVLLAPVKLLMRLENTGLWHRFIPLCVLKLTNKNNKHTKSFRGRLLDFRADIDAVDVALHEELRRDWMTYVNCAPCPHPPGGRSQMIMPRLGWFKHITPSNPQSQRPPGSAHRYGVVARYPELILQTLYIAGGGV